MATVAPKARTSATRTPVNASTEDPPLAGKNCEMRKIRLRGLEKSTRRPSPYDRPLPRGSLGSPKPHPGGHPRLAALEKRNCRWSSCGNGGELRGTCRNSYMALIKLSPFIRKIASGYEFPRSVSLCFGKLTCPLMFPVAPPYVSESLSATWPVSPPTAKPWYVRCDSVSNEVATLVL